MSYAQEVIRTLESNSALKVEKQPDGSYRMNSPLRVGSDSHCFILWLTDDTHGGYTDHKTKDTGSLFELGDYLGIERPQPAQRTHVQDSKRDYDNILDYAKAHGVTVADLHNAGWRECVKDNRPALSFPTTGGLRYRFLDTDGSKYKSEFGYQSCWYGLERAVKMATDEGKALVFCNGEVSVISGQAVGVPAITIGGGGEKSIPQPMLDELNSVWKGDIILALESDDAGRVATAKLKEQLPRAKVADLGLTEGGDLADYVKLHTFDASQSLHLIATENVHTPSSTPNESNVLSQLNNSLQQLTRQRLNNANSQDVNRLLDRATQELASARQQHSNIQVTTSKEIAQRSLADFEKRLANPSKLLGLSSGLASFDMLTLGFEAGKVYYFLASTSQGKSNLMRTLIDGLHTQKRGLIIPTESGVADYQNNLVAMLAKVEYLDVLFPARLKGDSVKIKAIRNAFEYVQDMYDFLPKGAPMSDDIRTALESGSYGWAVTDSLNNMGGFGTLYEKVSTNSKANIAIAKDFDIPLICTVQTGRNSKQRGNKEPELMDAKGAGDVEEDGDKIFSVYNHEHWMKVDDSIAPNWDEYPPNTIKVKLLKDRWHNLAGHKTDLTWGAGGKLLEYVKPVNSVKAQEGA